MGVNRCNRVTGVSIEPGPKGAATNSLLVYLLGSLDAGRLGPRHSASLIRTSAVAVSGHSDSRAGWLLRPKLGRPVGQGQSVKPAFQPFHPSAGKNNASELAKAAHFLNMFIRMSSSKKLPLLQEEMKPRSFNHVTNSRFTSLDSILGVAKPGRMLGSGSGIDCSMSFTC